LAAYGVNAATKCLKQIKRTEEMNLSSKSTTPVPSPVPSPYDSPKPDRKNEKQKNNEQNIVVDGEKNKTQIQNQQTQKKVSNSKTQTQQEKEKEATIEKKPHTPRRTSSAQEILEINKTNMKEKTSPNIKTITNINTSTKQTNVHTSNSKERLIQALKMETLKTEVTRTSSNHQSPFYLSESNCLFVHACFIFSLQNFYNCRG
jgi:hypothetical protein